MKKITSALLLTLSVTTFAQAKTTCRSTMLVLNPAKGSESLCQAMRLSGPVELLSCSNGEKIFKTMAYETALTTTSTGYASRSTFTDEETLNVSISEVSLSTKDRTFAARETLTDRRGHLRASAACTGTISF